jgi:hypothetical protein
MWEGGYGTGRIIDRINFKKFPASNLNGSLDSVILPVPAFPFTFPFRNCISSTVRWQMRLTHDGYLNEYVRLIAQSTDLGKKLIILRSPASVQSNVVKVQAY